MASAAVLKKNTENQSIAAARLRLSVGSANAASTASAGRPSISARSEPPIATHAASATSMPDSGTEMCRCSRCDRQRHNVHSASSHAGQRNQTSRRNNENTRLRRAVARPAPIPCAEQRCGKHRERAGRPAPMARSVAPPRSWSVRHTMLPTIESATAIAGAPLAASTGSANSTASLARRLPERARRQRLEEQRGPEPAAPVPASSRGRVAAGPDMRSSASSAPSAIARA